MVLFTTVVFGLMTKPLLSLLLKQGEGRHGVWDAVSKWWLGKFSRGYRRVEGQLGGLEMGSVDDGVGSSSAVKNGIRGSVDSAGGSR